MDNECFVLNPVDVRFIARQILEALFVLNSIAYPFCESIDLGNIHYILYFSLHSLWKRSYHESWLRNRGFRICINRSVLFQQTCHDSSQTCEYN